MVTDRSRNNKLVTYYGTRCTVQKISTDLWSYGNEKPTKTWSAFKK